MQKAASPGEPPESVPDAWPESLDRQTRFQQVLHHNHWGERHRIITSLNNDPAMTLQPLARRLAACGNGASLFIDPDKSKPTAWISRCGSRLCPFCSNARSAHTRDDLIPLILEHGAHRLMILTLRSNDDSLKTQIKTLMAAFRRLRNRKLWKDDITGGVRVLEITMNRKTKRWHPHLHILFKGNYIVQKILSKTWKQITGGSNIVWLQQVTNAAGAAAEMSKYIGKPQRISTLEPAQIRSYARATKSVRMIQTFGDCHAKPIADTDKPKDRPLSDHRINLSTLIHLARHGYESPMKLVASVADRFAIFRYYIWHELPLLNPNTNTQPTTAADLRRTTECRGPPDIKPNSTADLEVLDAEIAARYFVCLAELKNGHYANLHTYYETRTEDLHIALPG